ncbi:hypothetical protein CRUP_035472 [Coryphaenoides rupestris]|nr:hypothetical protein CRUP_035472 [Coryphaenoides rupestris]
MIAWLLTAFSTGLLAVCLYQWTAHPFFLEDLMYYLRIWRFKRETRTRMRKGVVTYLDSFLHQARETPDKAFLVYESLSLTYRDVDRRSNRFARVFAADASLKAGDVVALLMRNHPDFVCVWFGLCKLGCEAAFLNFNVKASSLLCCLQSCGATSLVVGADLVASLEEALPTLKAGDVSLWAVDHRPPGDGFGSLLDKLEKVSEEPLPDRPQAILSMAFLRFCGVTADDVVYITLPLYHMAASLLGVGGCIQLGATCVLKKKFSASQFWKDCVKYEVTVVQYIGELCRYLVNQAWVPEEGAHRVRLAAGSGLRPDVWREFARRFGNIRIREGYGLTEASLGFLNYTEEVGPIGRASYFNKLSMPFELLKYDPKTYDPIRDDSGRCIKVQQGEPGMLVAPLSATSQFLGYAGNKVQSEKKVLRDVVLPGDTSPDITETFKQKKGKLVQEGFNPEVVEEPLYFLSLSQKDYVSLSPRLYDDIISGKILL